MIDSVVDADGERLSEFREKIEADRTTNAKRFTAFKDARRRRAIDEQQVVRRRGRRRARARARRVFIVARGRPALDRRSPAGARRRRAGATSCWSRSACCAIAERGAARRRVHARPALAPPHEGGQIEAERWDAFRRYLTDFPRLQEAPPATLELWERFLVYGIAFGIAERVLQGAQLHMPEELHDQSTIYWISPTGDLGSGASALAIGDLSLRLRLGADAADVSGGSGRRRLLGRRRRRRRRRWRRGLVARAGLRACAPLVERDRARDRDVQRLARLGDRDRRDRVARGDDVVRQPLALGAEHEDRPLPELELGERRAARRATSATRVPAASSNRPSGTRKIAPGRARAAPSAPVGSAQPSESATEAPNASAVRISVPTFPGSATCQSASATGRCSHAGRSARRKTPITRGGCASVETPASSSGSTSLARDEQVDAARSRPRAPRRRGPRPRRRTARACPAAAGSPAGGSASGAGSRPR